MSTPRTSGLSDGQGVSSGTSRPPRVVVTRPRARAASMMESFRAGGVEPLLLPSIEIVEPEDRIPLDRAAAGLGEWDVVVFTSTAGVRSFAAALERAGTILDPFGPEVAAVGPSTAEAVRGLLGRVPDLVPEGDYSGEGLLDAFRAGGLRVEGRRVLLPLAEAAADLLTEGLAELGARVHRVTAYRTVLPGAEEVDAVRRAIGDGGVDLLTFTSPSTASNFAEAVGPAAFSVPAAAIGSVTADAAVALGYDVVVVAGEQTVPRLVEDSLAWLRARATPGHEEGTG